jgi:hypothetical protein
VEVHALASRGWSVSAIARHLGRDRKTVRAYLTGKRRPGRRAPAKPDPLAPFAGYLAARFADDPHLWASALFDEVVPLGYGLSYVSFARQLRAAGLRPRCEACAEGTVHMARCPADASHGAVQRNRGRDDRHRRFGWPRTGLGMLLTATAGTNDSPWRDKRADDSDSRRLTQIRWDRTLQK